MKKLQLLAMRYLMARLVWDYQLKENLREFLVNLCQASPSQAEQVINKFIKMGQQ